MKKEKIIIIGGKGSAVVIAEQIFDAQIKDGSVEFLGFAFDDIQYGAEINGFPILAKTYEVYEKYKKYNDVKFIYQLYRPDLMRERIELLESYKIPLSRYATFIHPSCVISRSANIGFGCSILANSVVNAGAVIGNHNTLQSNVLIGHDTELGDYNFIAAHNVVGSNISVGQGNFVGLNSSFNNYINIGNYCFIGMASNVLKSIDSNTKVYGNPAKPFHSAIKPL